jgi:NAD+ synthase
MGNLTEKALSFNKDEEVKKISDRLIEILRNDVHRRGLVVAMSSGIDSSVSAALCVKALGPKKVFGLLLPETDSSSESLQKGKLLAEHLGIEYLVHNIAPTLEAIGCYKWRDEAIKKTFPEYGEGWKNKIAIAGGTKGQFNHFMLIVQSPDGEIIEKRLALNEYLQIVAATNYKQRIRKTIEYFHADRLNYAVVGTPNRLEYDQGFFVKNGDGSADVKPIAHLYKSQVYDLARHLELPEEICSTTPTTDTYSLPQGQDEFYFALPYQQMDVALWAFNHDIPVAELAVELGIAENMAEYVYKDIESKRKTTKVLHMKGVLVEPVPEIVV